MRLTLHVDGPEEGEPQSPIPLSAWEAFARVLEGELASLYPDIARCGAVELSVTLLGADEMQSVNREYRECDEPTDVLSFPLWEEGGRFVPDGVMMELLPLGDILRRWSVFMGICPARRRFASCWRTASSICWRGITTPRNGRAPCGSARTLSKTAFWTC